MGFENTSGRNVVAHYGPRELDQHYGGEYGTKNATFVAEWIFDYDDLPVEGSTNFGVTIPANARILSARFEVITAFTSTSTTTDLDVGLAFATNTDDPNGLITATVLTQTAIAVVGDVLDGDGAFVGATIGDEKGWLTVTPNVDDLLTGRARVLVEYINAGNS